MKKTQLQELIRHITHKILKEFTSISKDNSKDSQQDVIDAPPEDAMTSSEKARMDRDKEHIRQRQLKQKEMELSAKKKEMEFNKKKLDQQKRFDIPNANKEIQRLKGAKI